MDQQPHDLYASSQPTPEFVNAPPQRNFPKWPLIVGGMLFVVGIAAAYILGTTQRLTSNTPPQSISPTVSPQAVTTTNTSTASWSLYSSANSPKTEPGPTFSVKYPKEQFVRLNCPGEELTLTKRTATSKEDVINAETCGRDGRFDIEIFTVPSTFNRPVNNENYIVVTKDIQVGGVQAKKYVSQVKGEPEGQYVTWNTQIFIPHGTSLHIVNYENKEYASVVEQMLSTFTLTNEIQTKFIEVTPTTVSINKMYTDSEFGYKISYPSIWTFRKTYGKDVVKMAPTDIISGFDIMYNNSSTNAITIAGNVLDAHGLTDIQEWITKYDPGYPKEASKVVTTFNGKQAVRYAYTNKYPQAEEVLYFISGQYAYRIFYKEAGEISELTRKVVNSITP